MKFLYLGVLFTVKAYSQQNQLAVLFSVLTIMTLIRNFTYISAELSKWKFKVNPFSSKKWQFQFDLKEKIQKIVFASSK